MHVRHHIFHAISKNCIVNKAEQKQKMKISAENLTSISDLSEREFESLLCFRRQISGASTERLGTRCWRFTGSSHTYNLRSDTRVIYLHRVHFYLNLTTAASKVAPLCTCQQRRISVSLISSMQGICYCYSPNPLQPFKSVTDMNKEL